MGANNSSEVAEFRGKYGSSAYTQGKPGIPEGIPKVTDITHNAITLSWLSPLVSGRILAYQVECCNLKDRKWRIITSTCQGTTYRVKNLVPETVYMFRVRAENIYGQSKPSHCSDEVNTRHEPTNYLEEKPTKKLVRRHSHYLKLDSGLNQFMNKTEEDQVDSANSVGSIPFRRNSTRGSLPPGFRTKKNSVTSFLPGANAKRESMCSLKDAKRSFEESSIPEEEGLNLKRISTSSTEASSLFSSNSMTSIVEDEELRILYGQTDCHMCSDNDDVCSMANSQITTSSGFSSASSRSSNSGLGQSCMHNVLVHCPPLPETEEESLRPSYLNASVTDDIKLDFMSNSEKNFVGSKSRQPCRTRSSKENNPNCGKTIFDICDNEIWKGRIEHMCENDTCSDVAYGNQGTLNSNKRNSLDLRSLRNMLNSGDMMVKTTDSACGVYDTLRSRSHCAIKETDENIHIDIVSSI
ncbi:MYLK-like protein [Mya arenaria]|uniref:MYLK-like protein n=1 Tax=Mya arenaria TaxID=6604 RepID=A0ABY7ELV7_MYAAR|nr:MYLK-like protein [Mya arenaria]